MALLPRQYYGGNSNCYYDRYNNLQCNNSPWYSWGRWVLLAIILVGVALIFFLFSCITARRRRRMGYTPYRGTGWALGRTPAGHGPAQYNPQQTQQQTQQPYYQSQPYNNNSNAPPAYQPGNAGYYGNTDPNVQHPPAAYKAPEGPPPNHVVR